MKERPVVSCDQIRPAIADADDDLIQQECGVDSESLNGFGLFEC